MQPTDPERHDLLPVIRPERPDDAPSIRALHDQAFGGPVEGAIVDALRGTPDAIEDGSLVAVDRDGRIIGHVLVSRGTLTSASGGPHAIWMLGPIGVLPHHQGQGVGSALMRAIIDVAIDRGVGLVCLLGHADYYPRFGFVAARSLGIEPPDATWTDDHWMALPLPGWTPEVHGIARYTAAFEV